MSTPHIGPQSRDTGLTHRRSTAMSLAIAFLPVPVVLAAVLFDQAGRPEAATALRPARAPVSAIKPVVPEAPPVDVARKELAALTVEAPHSLEGYSREKFQHWVEDQWPRTQEVVLHRDGKQVGVSQAQTASKHWHSPYDDRILTTRSDVHVDHVVPLADAWRSGADQWSPARRHKFANDLSTTQLIAISVVANRSKGDQSPDQWVPPNGAYHCVYGRAWTHVKFTYGLSVTEKEKAALRSLLDTCH